MRAMTRTIWALLALLAVVPSAAAQTDPYPSRPITIIVPFPPGGSSDVVTRLGANWRDHIPVLVMHDGCHRPNTKPQDRSRRLS